MFKIILELTYITNLVKYILFFRGILGEKVQKFYIGIASCAVWPLFMLLPVVMNTIPGQIAVYVLWIPFFFMMEGKWYKRCIMMFLTELVLNTMQEVIVAVMKYLLHVPFHMKGASYLISNIVVIVGLGVWSIILRKRKRTERRRIPALLVYGSICLAMFITSLSATFLPVISAYVSEKWVVATARGMELLVLVSVLLISVLVYYIYRTNEMLESAYDVERNLKETQAVYYETLLRREQETRDFRHDLSSQLLCISHLAAEENAQDVLSYVEQMTDTLENISRTSFHTGNSILDIMLNYYVSELKKEVSVRVTGILEKEFASDKMQLCTIFSNALKNAVEELNTIQEERVHLHIFLRCGLENSIVRIENSSREKKKGKEGFETSKKDKKNHGIGIRNMHRALESCGGVCEFIYENGTFITEIYIPHKKILPERSHAS